jgi:hypothetical protein
MLQVTKTARWASSANTVVSLDCWRLVSSGSRVRRVRRTPIRTPFPEEPVLPDSWTTSKATVMPASPTPTRSTATSSEHGSGINAADKTPLTPTKTSEEVYLEYCS